MNKHLVTLSFALLIVVGVFCNLNSHSTDKQFSTPLSVTYPHEVNEKLVNSIYCAFFNEEANFDFIKKVYGVRGLHYKAIHQKVEVKQSLEDLFVENNVSFRGINKALKKKRIDFDTAASLTPNQPYIILSDKAQKAKYFIYELDEMTYILFDLRRGKSPRVFKREKKVSVRTEVASGIISNSLYAALVAKKSNPKLAASLEDIFDWTIDFFKLQKGDEFKVIYEENLAEGVPVGIRKIKAAYFKHKGKSHYAFAFDSNKDKKVEYYDEKGQSLKKGFLKAPVKFSRISSGFSKRRYHPVLKRYKSHLGIDYAAPTGTPIRTVGDGVVIASEYGRANGRYVKIKHNDTYSTQYLHLSRYGKGIKKGAKVSQGQIIGYVGSTGLATGPHLCYRFWKNGQQVNPAKEYRAYNPMLPKKYRKKFNARKNKLKKVLAKIK